MIKKFIQRMQNNHHHFSDDHLKTFLKLSKKAEQNRQYLRIKELQEKVSKLKQENEELLQEQVRHRVKSSSIIQKQKERIIQLQVMNQVLENKVNFLNKVVGVQAFSKVVSGNGKVKKSIKHNQVQNNTQDLGLSNQLQQKLKKQKSQQHLVVNSKAVQLFQEISSKKKKQALQIPIAPQLCKEKVNNNKFIQYQQATSIQTNFSNTSTYRILKEQNRMLRQILDKKLYERFNNQKVTSNRS